jgi:hypothetical protein
MKQKIVVSALFLVTCLVGVGRPELEVTHGIGMGTRAYGLANNFVGLSSDQSALYWNPAGLAFAPAREFQVSFDVLSQNVNSTFNQNKESPQPLQRPRLANIGYLHAFPTVQGGFTIAGAFFSPVIFDENRRFSGSYTTKQTPSKTVNVERNSRKFGGLDQWCGGFGLQIAKGLGIGLSASLVSGKEDGRIVFYQDTNGRVGDPIYDDYDQYFSRNYIGWDIRLGLLYSFLEHYNIGMRFVVPQTIMFWEDISETYPHSPSEPDYTSQSTGNLKSSYSGALGVSGVFSFLTASTELRVRAPYSFLFPEENIPSGSLAGKTRMGAGAGVEIPLFVSTALLRLGYSWDQYDTHMFARKYEDEKGFYWDNEGKTPVGDRHLVTAGVGFIFKNVCLEGSYGYTFWKLDTRGTLQENYSQHRLVTSLSVRF